MSPPVSVPHVVCAVCGSPCGIWSPLCKDCADGLPPHIGERYRDIVEDIQRDQE